MKQYRKTMWRSWAFGWRRCACEACGLCGHAGKRLVTVCKGFERETSGYFGDEMYWFEKAREEEGN